MLLVKFKNKTMFKTDSDVVRRVYSSLPNYKIDYDNNCADMICAVYFSSNDIYYPNTEEIFRKRIVEKDFFEWYHTRVRARKHIFVRDVFKQWYLEGINADIDMAQYRHLITPLSGISLSCLRFRTSHHGIPFLKVALPRVLNMWDEELLRYARKKNRPVWFTVRMVGVVKAARGFVEQTWKAYRKRK